MSKIKVLSSDNFENKKQLFGLITFTYQLSSGEVIELKENGSNIYLDENNWEEFLDLYIKFIINQGYLQAKAVQEGLFSVIPEYILKFLTPQDLEKKICGEPEFDVELLKKITEYNGYKFDDITIQFFWTFLEECSLEDKFNYLKFVWGRSKLPKDSSKVKQKHQIIKDTSSNNNNIKLYLPKSYTCFFSLVLPPYEDYNTLKEKLLYAIRNSFVISDNNDDINFDFDN